MCLIVDANVVPEVFLPTGKDFMSVHRALRDGRATAVRGGTKLREEYDRLGKLRRVLLEFDRRGSLRAVPDAAVDRESHSLRDAGTCRSDDEHVIALARVSGARLLCSRDGDLHGDFTNPKLLSPRGAVYQRSSHRHLIRKYCGECPVCARRGAQR
jgi:hypothetical protein